MNKHLERAKRLWAAEEARKRGGIKLVAEATRMSPTTIRRGLREPLTGQKGGFSLGRSSGGGRKKTEAIHTDACKELEILIEPVTPSNSESPLRWTCKSLRQLTEELVQRKIKISPNSVRGLLNEMGYSLQANRKARRGINHPERNAQFEYINNQAKDYLLARQPVIFVDTKKLKNLDEPVSYNVDDDEKNVGWASIGINHDTAPFTANSIQSWWKEKGLPCFPQANRLLIVVDADDNSYRMRLWKVPLQELSSGYQLDITVCHFPPGTSKWNKIEHHPFLSVNLTTIVNLIGISATNKKLSDHSVIDKTSDEKRVKVSDEELNAIAIQEHDFHGEWNYTIYKRTIQ